MSGLFSSLNLSVKALNAQSRAIDISGRNLANVNNPNYARQRVVFGDRGTVMTPDGAQSLGIEALSVEQLRDTILDKQVVREISLTSGYTAEQQAYQRAQAALGQSVDGATDSSSGLGSDLDDFFNAFQSFATRPTDSGERQSLIQKAAILSDRFQLTDSRLAQVQTDLDAQIETDVESANTLLSTIADLNAQIAKVEVSNPGSAIDLRDQRQAKLEELAAYLPVETRTSTDGQVKVVMKDASDVDVILVDDATVEGSVAFTGSAITAGASATTVAATSGSVQGALTARDGAVQTLRDNLDALAEQLVTSVNAAYGGSFFDSSGLDASSISLDSALTATSLVAGSGSAGDNSLALAVVAVANQTFATASGDLIDGTLSQFYGSTVTSIGQSLANTNLRVEDQGGIETLVRSQRDSISGVSLDEEMADLVKYQRAFQASSRVFSVVDELLDNVVSNLGA